jgi:hypothetical protein
MPGLYSKTSTMHSRESSKSMAMESVQRMKIREENRKAVATGLCRLNMGWGPPLLWFRGCDGAN